MKKSFANRLILNFTCVVFLGFLIVYFLFNFLLDTHIRLEAEAELSREILMIQENNVIEYIPVLDAFDGLTTFHIRSNRISQNAIVNVNTIIIDDDVILHPNPQNLSESESYTVKALATFWQRNQSEFEASDDMIMTAYGGHTFYMRATSLYIIPANPFDAFIPVTALMYTDITPAMNLKSSMNQVLFALLAVSGTLTLGISILLSTRFKQAIQRLSNHAEFIGQGNFTEKVTDLSYLEFEELGSSMNTMADMLGTYEMHEKQFFQNASHELRTPLMSIQGYAEALQSDVFENDYAANIILEESQKMTTLINDILYLSKLNTSQSMTMDLHLVTVEDLITGCAERVQILAQKESKNLIVNVVAETSIHTDQDKLERAIINILSNAIRYARDEIRMDCYMEQQMLIISITNDGSGIDAADMPHIFDRFYKGHNGNTGLGLAITKDIVMKLGGRVCCENLEFGVKFVIKLPMTQT